LSAVPRDAPGTVVEVPAAEGVEIRLPSWGTLRVAAVDADGCALVDECVLLKRIEGHADGDGGAVGWTDPDGVFSSRLLPGDYQIHAPGPGNVVAERARVTVRPNQETTSRIVVLSK
jgi:hypothetical protein